MLHFFGILTPAGAPNPDQTEQKPFFGPEWRLSRCERDATLLSGKCPDHGEEPDDWTERRSSFAGMLSQPYF